MRAAQTILTRGELPTAVFAANDLTAAGMMDTSCAAGCGSPPTSRWSATTTSTSPALRQLSLTTVDQPRTTMGRQALELLIERIEGREERVMRLVEPTLVVRDTAGRVRQ